MAILNGLLLNFISSDLLSSVTGSSEHVAVFTAGHRKLLSEKLLLTKSVMA